MSTERSDPAYVQCYLANAQSLRNKLPDLHYMLSSLQFQVLAFTETFLSEQDPDSLLLSEASRDYCLFRTDRSCSRGRGGGVALFCLQRLNPVVVPLPAEFVSCECVAIDMQAPLSYRVICAYRPPAASPEQSSLLYRLLDALCQVNCPVSMVGDYNLPLFDWPTFRCPDIVVYSEFAELVSENALVQKVRSPTRLQNILDLVLCTDELTVSEVRVGPAFGQSDHCSVEFGLLLGREEPVAEQSVPLRDFRRMDVAAAQYYTGLINWQCVFESCADDPARMWDKFKSVLDDVFDQSVPWLRTPVRRKRPSHLSKLLAKKRRLHSKSRHLRTIESRQEYRAACRDYSVVVRQHYELLEQHVLKSCSASKFYAYVNKKRSVRSGVAPLQRLDGSMAVADSSKAAALNDQFCSVFTNDNGHLPEFSPKASGTAVFDSFAISTESVRKVLCKLDKKYERDPDGVPSAVLRLLSYQLVEPLAILFMRFLATGFVPPSWKTADIVGIFKKGAASVPANYRPVSITSSFCRVFERILVDNLSYYLHKLGLLSTEQFGFVKRRSAELQLLSCVDIWSQSLDTNLCTDVILLDLAKAFDSVSHPKLLYILEQYGICGAVLHWVKAWLCGRMQRVKVGTEYSGYRPVVSGVPQGTVSGPLLFILYVNGLVDVLSPEVTVKQFADDITLFLQFRFSYERSVLQNNLLNVVGWTSDWQLRVQPAKSTVMTIGKCGEPAVYSIGDDVLPCASSIVNLGVTIDANLSFKQHVSTIVCKAHCSLALIFRAFLTSNRSALLHAYMSYVRPILEYACTVWSPMLHGRSSLSCLASIDKIESVQRLFTRRLVFRCKLPQLPYVQRLATLKLEPLELRRLKRSLCMTYKILNGLVDFDYSELFQYCNSVTRGHAYRLRCPRYWKDAWRNSFAVAIVPVWNSLPEVLVSARSFLLFKKKLDQYNDFLLQHCVFDRNL